MNTLPSPGPALGAWQVGKAVNQALSNMRIHKANVPDQPPLGYKDLIGFLRAAHDEMASYWPSTPISTKEPSDGAPAASQRHSRKNKEV